MPSRHLQPLSGARAFKVGLVALLEGCKKFSGCNVRSPSPEGGNLAENELSPLLQRTPYSPFQLSGTPSSERYLHCSGRPASTPPLAARGRLGLLLSFAARSVVTPLSERRGGKVAQGCHAAVLLRHLLPSVLQWREAAWREYKRCAGRGGKTRGGGGCCARLGELRCDAEALLR